MRTRRPTPSRSSVWKGFVGRIFTGWSSPGSSRPSTYFSRNLPSASSRLMPKVVCVRSLVPKLKKSATSAICPAVSAARGSSIIVPNLYCTCPPSSDVISLATASSWRRTSRSSLTCPTSGIMIFGWSLMPSFATFAAASRIARAGLGVAHRAEDALEVRPLERQQLIELLLSLFHVRRENHLLHDGQALRSEERRV